MSIVIFTEESSLFGSPFLAEALDANLYVMIPQYSNFFQAGTQGAHWRKGDVVNGDNLIVIGAVALRNIAPRIENGDYKTVALIVSDSVFCRDHEWVNKFVERNRITVYAMPDMFEFLRVDYIPAYQCMRVRQDFISPKTERVTISHSPSNPEKAVLKGAPQIENTIFKLKKQFDFDYIRIEQKPMDECLRLKSSSHIFVDQLINGNPHVPQDRWGKKIKYSGGLGKSGIEAMLLGSCVITGGMKPATEPFFPPPPIIWTSLGMFYDDLKDLIVQKEKRESLAIEQLVWATKYCGYEFARKHFTQHIS